MRIIGELKTYFYYFDGVFVNKIIAIMLMIGVFGSSSVPVSYAALPDSSAVTTQDKSSVNTPNSGVTKDSNANKATSDQAKKGQEPYDIKQALTVGIATSIFFIVGALLTGMVP